MTSEQYEALQALIPVPIREDAIVQVQGIPHDLTASEAARISAVILALTNSPERGA